MDLTKEELGTVITVRQMREVGACARGQVRWFQLKGLDHHDILKNGVTLQTLVDHLDGEVKQVIERVVANMREQDNGR